MEDFLSFVTFIFTPRYDKRFRSYAIFNVDEAAENSVLDRKEHPQKSGLLIPISIQSQETFHTNNVANFLVFLTAIYMPSYDQWFKSYELWKLTGLMKFNSGQKGLTWVIRSPDHPQNGNPVNTENQTRKYFVKFPMHPYTTYSVRRTQVMVT
jgi:hypothetical protein